MKKNLISVLTALMVMVAAACGGGGSSSTSVPAPAAPANPAAIGSLGNIHVSWDAGTEADLTGYNLYKSTDGAVFTAVNAVLIAETSYDDAIASPGGDGVLYHYRITAVGGRESGPSVAVRGIHGTRLASSLASGITTTGLGPYIVEGSVTSEASVNIAGGTKLYVLDNGSLDILQGNSLVVNGLFRILASTSATATLTSHATGTGLGADQGFKITIDSCVDYGTGDGTLFQNARILNLQAGASVDINNCNPKLYNLAISANSDTAASWMNLQSSSGVVLQQCSLTGLHTMIYGDQRTTGFRMDHNIITPGPYSYVLDLYNASTAPINAGQIAYNVFDSAAQIDLATETGGVAIPLGNNFWRQGVPGTRSQGGSTSTVDLTPTLGSAPADAGPTW